VPQVIYKFAQSQDIIPLSGTKNEEHMQQDVAVEKLPLQGDDVQGLLEAVGAFVAGPT
jgi:diketogulonate reductase-like aldo/keto reductase